MIISVPNQSGPKERRVALTPDAVPPLVEDGHTVHIENSAGTSAGYPDEHYVEAGATIVESGWGGDVIPVVAPPTSEQRAKLPEGAVVVGLLRPLDEPGGIAQLAKTGVTALAFETLPRITRAQSMDALSSQATVVGYQAVVEAAALLPRFLPMLTTAAGTIRPAKALILGAGVAGLQAIATARRLGAVVSAFDVRSAAAEQVESLGARFIEAVTTPQDAATSGGYAKELAADEQSIMIANLAPHVIDADIVITTAQIPGRQAPLLITEETVAAMRPGAVIVDAAAATGGNCAPTVKGETIQVHGVTIIGDTDLASRVAGDASRMYARNVITLLKLALAGREQATDPIDLSDEVLAGCAVTHAGNITNDRVRAMLEEA